MSRFNSSQYQYNGASGGGLAAPVLARPVFLKVKINFHFYKKQLINKSASMIFGFDRLNILSSNRNKSI